MPDSPPRPMHRSRPAVRLWAALALLVLLLVGGIAWGLKTIYQAREQDYRHQIERELTAISQLQAKSASEWRERRLIDAMALSDDSLFSQAVARWLADPTPERQAPVRERLRTLQERTRYSAVFLVEPSGRMLLTPEDTQLGTIPGPEQQALQQAMLQAQPVLIEPRRDAVFAFPFFGVIAPLFDGITPIGAVWLVSDVRSSLYPLLEAWPSHSRSAESILVQRSGDDVLYLSPLRQRSDAPLTVRQPISSHSNSPAVQALQGGRGILYGRDYRNEEVMAMVSPVAESPWFLISKIDMAEAFTDVRLREWLALGLPVSLVMLLLGFLTAYWQWRARRRERRLQRELQRNMRWLDTAQKAATVGYFSYDEENQQFFMSPMTCQIYGLPMPANGMVPLQTWTRCLHPQEKRDILTVHGKAMAEHSPLRVQYRILRASDQQVRWVQIWADYERPDEGSPHQAPRMTGTVQDITERKQAEEQLTSYRQALEAQVRTDPLTQVANRRALDEAMAQEWNRTTRSNAPLALLMIDVDHFKAYNDHYGHVAGDQCLRLVAQALARQVERTGEMVARYGGEEFAVLLPHTDAAQAQALAERLRAAVCDLGLEHQASAEHRQVTVSIGVACIDPALFAAATPAAPEPGAAFPDAAEAVRALIHQADTALYNAKKAGRNRVMACPAPGAPLPAPL